MEASLVTFGGGIDGATADCCGAASNRGDVDH